MTAKLLTEHNLEFLTLKGGCTVSSESTLVKMPHCWKSHVTVYIMLPLFNHRLAMPLHTGRESSNVLLLLDVEFLKVSKIKKVGHISNHFKKTRLGLSH